MKKLFSLILIITLSSCASQYYDSYIYKSEKYIYSPDIKGELLVYLDRLGKLEDSKVYDNTIYVKEKEVLNQEYGLFEVTYHYYFTIHQGKVEVKVTDILVKHTKGKHYKDRYKRCIEDEVRRKIYRILSGLEVQADY